MAKRKSNVAQAASIVKLVANRREGKPKGSKGLAFIPDLPIDEVVAGVGGYGATRLGARLANLPIQKRWPRVARHAPPALAAVGFFIILWLTGKLPKKYEKYIMPILVGSGIAVVHEAIRALTPGLGWLVGFDQPPILAPTVPQLALRSPQLAVEPIDEDSYYREDPDVSQDTNDEDADLKTGIFTVK